MSNAERSTTVFDDEALNSASQDELRYPSAQYSVGQYQLPPDVRAAFPNNNIGVSPLERWLLGRLLKSMGDPPLQIVLWNGEVITTTGQSPVARILFKKRRTILSVLRNPGLYFGDAYSVGDVEVEGDLIQALEYAYRSGADMEKRWVSPSRILKWMNRSRSTALRRSRENIHHHYDIGNDFYRLWLDNDMVYTCAYYPTLAASLEEAQRAKLDLVCRKLRLRPGETVVEAGCGWGALARFMARHYGVTVKAMNISREQIAYAREAAAAEGLSDRVEFIEDDYRNIRGEFDVFVSVGMLEHVGKEHYHDLGGVINRSLKENGRGLLHSIGRNKPCPMNAWIDRRIFPGAYPPSLHEMMEILEPWDLSVLDVENLRLHYAKTIMDWLERYERVFDQVAEMYDENFARAWRMYLAGSIAGFTTGWLQLFQVVFTRSTVNDIPWTRSHLYDK